MIFFFILITCLLDVVLTFVLRLAQKIFPFLLSSHPIKFKTWNNQDLMTGILLRFTLSSHWLPVIFSFVLIGHYHNSNKKSSDLREKKKYLDCTCTYQLLSSCCTHIDYFFRDDTFYHFLIWEKKYSDCICTY